MKLWENESARVPLAVIGVLFVMISAVVSINISRMDAQMAAAIVSGDDMDCADTALLYANADLARAVNYAGMEALKQMGETPVIELDNSSQYSSGGANTSVTEFNRNWAKGMIAHTLNQYIESNYMYDSYTYRGYGINAEPLKRWQDIEITPIHMALDRELETSILPPTDAYETYWKITVPLNISIVDLASGDMIDTQHIVVGNLITSRYPLLEELTSEYEQRLNGADAVMAETTAFAMGYTWARGYYQYLKPLKGPKNIVDNEHLGLMVNGGLMLDQGFVFNSVDPASIIEYGMQTKRTLEGKKNMDTAKFLNSAKLDNGSYKIDPTTDAANSTGDPDNASKALEDALHFDYNATPITEFLNNDSMPRGSEVRQQINKIIPWVYNAKLATGVARQTNVNMGAHDGYSSSHKIDDWGEPDSMKRLEVLPRDTYVPGNLFGEVWEVKWTRQHVWRHYYQVEYPCLINGIMSTCTRTEHKEMTAIDTRVDRVAVTIKAKENSKTSISLDYAGTTLSTGNDVVKAFNPKDVTYASTYTDPCLEEAYNSYKSKIFDPNMTANIKDMNLNSENCDPNNIEVAEPIWLKGEVQDAVDEINREIRSDVHLGPEINYKEYPNPADAMRATAIDLTTKIKANQSRYVDEAKYRSGGKYSSCSAKTISQVRKWYVDQVLHQINEQYGGASDKIDNEINSSFGDSADGVREANKNGAGLLKSVMCFPIGFTMKAEHVMPNGTHFGKDELAYWDENVTLGVDMEPDYLFEESDGGKKLINLGVQNVCLFGPTGVPVLPPPNYVVHFNSWIINVEGRIDEFTLFDVDNECHPHPIFGHEAQVYKRKIDTVYDPITNIPIGLNLPIKFKFDTGTFIAVPPTGKPIGDKDGYNNQELLFGETSSKYGKI